MSAIAECSQPGRGVRVITISIGGSGMGAYELSNLEDRINEAHRYRNINVVAAAGNEAHHSAVSYPARFGASFAVGATDTSGAFCGFSNRGAGLDISSLGCDLQMTGFDGSPRTFAGTSFATPTVAGVLLALRAHRPDLTATHAEQLLLDHARSTSAGRVVDAAAAFRGAGLGQLVDAYKAPMPRSETTDHPTNVTVDDERPARPRLIAATFKRGVMRLRVAKPRRGAEAIFRVNGKSYVQASGSLTLRMRSWKSVSVLIEDQWGVRSELLKVRRPGRR